MTKMLEDVTDNHWLVYVEHLEAVPHDMHSRLKDLLKLEVFPWTTEPFATTMLVSECDPATQELFRDMQSNEESHAIFNAHERADFWIKCDGRFPGLWEKAK